MVPALIGCSSPDGENSRPESFEGPIPRLVGDLDGDGREEAVIELPSERDRGQTQMWGLYRRAGADLVPVRVEGEGAFRFAIGIEARSQVGLWCRDVDRVPGTEVIVVRLHERSNSGSPWVKHVYRWAGRNLTLEAKHEGNLRVARSSDRLVDAFHALRCGSFDSRSASS